MDTEHALRRVALHFVHAEPVRRRRHFRIRLRIHDNGRQRDQRRDGVAARIAPLARHHAMVGRHGNPRFDRRRALHGRRGEQVALPARIERQVQRGLQQPRARDGAAPLADLRRALRGLHRRPRRARHVGFRRGVPRVRGDFHGRVQHAQRKHHVLPEPGHRMVAHPFYGAGRDQLHALCLAPGRTLEPMAAGRGNEGLPLDPVRRLVAHRGGPTLFRKGRGLGRRLPCGCIPGDIDHDHHRICGGRIFRAGCSSR